MFTHAFKRLTAGRHSTSTSVVLTSLDPKKTCSRIAASTRSVRPLVCRCQKPEGRPHSRRILDDRASLWLYHCPIVRDNLRALWRNPIMQNPLIIGCIVFLILLAGAFASWTIRQRLPEHHLTDDTKSLVSVSMVVVATVSALVLGLLISNANTSFRALGGDVPRYRRKSSDSTTYCADTGRTHIQLGRHCDSMPNRRLPICFPTKGQTFASTTRRHTHCSSGSKIRCSN